MTRDQVKTICDALPATEWSEPFGPGHDVWKIGGKIFAAIGAKTQGISVKTPDIETATMLIEAGVGVKAPYFHRSWVNLPFGADKDELIHRIHRSYALVRGSLTKKAQAALPPFEDQANG
ncbi:Predicted DNA-binding protein, MmcQ/YjbR family [Aliiroseovarius halocynthiae]|uniref:MmcQ/YjbR family DNA-binding protein n=1 Tax=Aliiroseovarius halocynthiae TaxID=985055 RepID=A0A545SWH1_9RHOB|nr:MmcQ/YjbR family DNA-binding protein [Aliiroseovarius halocynthiae]TQV69311.1 MmcQ/YjbR family DNA-binding protein [Aliiroseovarius halocynthiae]SMR72091.1 Predicted DNA-binding protein, MmcQ/YjbR family [Aliiroseovarius halocynthiae]